MINRKLSSKIITGLFAVMVGVAGVQGVTAYASNYSDTAFEFSFDNGGSDETEARRKEDDSYVYIKSTSCDGEDVGFRAYAYGCYSSDKSDGESLTPSPVTATISPISCKLVTTRNFCSGATRAKITSSFNFFSFTVQCTIR